MSVTLSRDTTRGKRPVFAKVLELFTGGLGWATGAITRSDGINVPKGALLDIDESARTCSPVKRGRFTAEVASDATAATIQHGSMFAVGDRFSHEGTAGTAALVVVTERANDTYLAWAGAIGGTAASGSTMEDFGDDGTNLTGTANAIAALPSTVGSGASVSVLRRGTVYTNRVQPLAARDDFGATGGAILFSDSN